MAKHELHERLEELDLAINNAVGNGDNQLADVLAGEMRALILIHGDLL